MSAKVKSVSEGNFQTGGRNPNWQSVCQTCLHRIPSREHDGWGWCSLRNKASVAPHGGCDFHQEGKPVGVQ